MSNNEKDQVEIPGAHADIETARNLPDAANAQQSLEGYAAINADPDSEIAQVAFALFQQRGEETGDADGDWFRAEQEVRRRRQQRGS
jgi:hypothetical protein